MKIHNRLWQLVIPSLLSISTAFTQSTGNNNWGLTKYLGWDGSNGPNPLYTRTNFTNRTKLNGNLSYSVNGITAPRNGYMLLSPLQNSGLSGSTGQLFDANRGAFSLLHINGFGTAQEFGVRSWWKTGITLTDNSDASYIGLRQIGSGIDVTETVINWTDNTATWPYGPDDMAFRFTSAGSGAIASSMTEFPDVN